MISIPSFPFFLQEIVIPVPFPPAQHVPCISDPVLETVDHRLDEAVSFLRRLLLIILARWSIYASRQDVVGCAQRNEERERDKPDTQSEV